MNLVDSSPLWLFGLLALAMTALAAAAVARPLLKPRQETRGVNAQTNAALRILREQTAELRRDHLSGKLRDEAFQQAMEDLERRALLEGQSGGQIAHAVPQPLWAIGMVGLLAILTLGGYLALGQPAGIIPANVAAPSSSTDADAMAAMVNTLATRLEASDGTPSEWAMLARSSMVIQDYEQAARAYARLSALEPGNADALASQAEALILLHDSVTPQAQALISQARALSPDDTKTLLLSGSVAYQQRDYAQAVQYWQQLLDLIGPDDPDAANLRAAILDAETAGKP